MHTKGPLEWSSAGHGSKDGIVLDEYFVRVPGDDVALAADIVDPATGKPSEANARRIVAMWNALQHVSTEKLESLEVTKASWELTKATATIESLRKEREELLVALEVTLAELEGFIVQVDSVHGEGRDMADMEAAGLLGDAIPLARSAIKKARGAV